MAFPEGWPLIRAASQNGSTVFLFKNDEVRNETVIQSRNKNLIKFFMLFFMINTYKHRNEYLCVILTRNKEILK